MSDPFQFISLAEIQQLGTPIVHLVTAEEIQEFAEDNCGGRLSDEELQGLARVFQETWSCDYLHDAISKIRPDLRATS